MKEILSHLLANAEARSLVSNSFPKMHINNKINVSVKTMCRVAAKKQYRVLLLRLIIYNYVSNQCTYHCSLLITL